MALKITINQTVVAQTYMTVNHRPEKRASTPIMFYRVLIG